MVAFALAKLPSARRFEVHRLLERGAVAIFCFNNGYPNHFAPSRGGP